MVRQQAELRVAHLATIRRLLQRDVGHFEHLPHTDLQLVGIPTGQSQAFFCDPSYRVDQARLGRLARLRGEELFGGWQREAKALGWGPNQACAYLREARNVKLKTDLVNGYQWLCEKGLDRVQRARASLKRLLGF